MEFAGQQRARIATDETRTSVETPICELRARVPFCGLGGDDKITGGGGKGRDTLTGGGNDRLLARDRARDVVNGGKGRDNARVDKSDRMRSIESGVRGGRR